MNRVKIQVNLHNYTCIVTLGPTEGATITVCEGGSSSLSCSSPYTIDVTAATWGRSSASTCSWDWSSCNDYNVRTTTENNCDGQYSCTVYANTGTYGDPCGGVSKYLTVTYSCTSTFRSFHEISHNHFCRQNILSSIWS